MEYPFFISSLPTLKPGEVPDWSPDRFLDEARRNLSPGDLAALEALADGAPSDAPFVAAYRAFDTQLRNACARIRAARLGTDARPYLREEAGDAPFDASLEARVRAVFQSAANPLVREDGLAALRSEAAEALAGESPFGVGAVLSYFVRLRLAWSVADRSAEAGRKRLEKAVSEATVGLSVKDSSPL